jgi:chromosome segregation ATPase
MNTVDLTVELLKQIRDGVHDLGARLDATNLRLEEANARLNDMNRRLDRTRTELLESIARVETRLDGVETRLDGVEGELGSFRGQFAEGLKLMHQIVERDERRTAEIADLRRRVETLEGAPP